VPSTPDQIVAVATPAFVVRVVSQVITSMFSPNPGDVFWFGTQLLMVNVTDVLSGTSLPPEVTRALSRIPPFTSASAGDAVSEIENATGVGDGGGAVGLLEEHAGKRTIAPSSRPNRTFLALMVVSRIDPPSLGDVEEVQIDVEHCADPPA
jgi:hypothetical protein